MKTRKHINLNVWPVAQRELREGARRPVNHRLRFLSAVVGTVLLWSIVANYQGAVERLGVWLLGGLHAVVLGLIFVIVPGLTADCIAREKREGTLGLLFLTPLKAGGIVAGKALVSLLRAFTLWLAVVPILIIPFLAGGVTWVDAFSALSLEFCATVLCLAAGLLASSVARERNTAFLLAYVFAACLCYLSSLLVALVIATQFAMFFSAGVFMGSIPWWRLNWIISPFFTGWDLGGWSMILTRNPGLGRIWKPLCLGSMLLSLLVFYLIARFAARRINRSWQDKVPSARRESLLRRYCTPLFQRRFRRKMQRTLDWNPIVWLQQYSWKARLSKWGLCLVFVLVLIGDLRNLGSDGNYLVHRWMLLILAGIYTFAGVSSFLEEKRSGALELILVTPISVNQLIFGRVWGLWKQFFPSAMIMLADYAVWVVYGGYITNEDQLALFIIVCGFLTLPVFATYFALRLKNLIVAAVLTWVALWIPWFLAEEAFENFVGVAYEQGMGFMMILPMFLSYLAFALLARSLLRHSLSRRIYSF